MTTIQKQDDPEISSQLPTSSHFIEIPIPSTHVPTQLVVHVTQFKGKSLMIWCGEANPTLANAILSSKNQRDQSSQSKTAVETGRVSSLLMEENHPASLPDQVKPTTHAPPTGLLGNEWAVAMTSNLNNSNTISTSLFRSNLDISKPMASRLSKRFQIPQLFLSLSLPDQLLSMLDGPFADPLGGKALMLLEGALGNVIKSNLEENNTTTK